MDFGTRHLLRHRKVYRSMDLPFGIARLWSNIEEVSFEYIEARDEVIVRPVRPVRNGTQATTKATASVEAKTEPSRKDINNTPQAHFSL